MGRGNTVACKIILSASLRCVLSSFRVTAILQLLLLRPLPALRRISWVHPCRKISNPLLPPTHQVVQLSYKQNALRVLLLLESRCTGCLTRVGKHLLATMAGFPIELEGKEGDREGDQEGVVVEAGLLTRPVWMEPTLT